MTHDEDTLPQVVGCTLAMQEEILEDKDEEISRLKQKCADLEKDLQEKYDALKKVTTENGELKDEHLGLEVQLLDVKRKFFSQGQILIDLNLKLQHQEERIRGLLTQDMALLSLIQSMERSLVSFWPFCFRWRIVSRLRKIVGLGKT